MANEAISTPSATPSGGLQSTIVTLNCLCRAGANAPCMMPLGRYLRVIGHAGRISRIDRFFDQIKRRADVWVARRIEIVRQGAKSYAILNALQETSA